MNGLVFLLPFILITIIGLSQDSYAATDETIVGINYFDVVNPDGTHTWSTHHEYILDNGIYVPYVQNGLTVNSKIGDVTLNQDGSYTWNGKFDDRIIGKYADITDLTSWTYPNTLNNDTPDVSFVNGEFHSNKIKSGVADMDYKYVFNNGQWKTELVITNLSSLTTKVFGFDQIIDLNTDSIEIDGRIYNIDDFDGVVLSKLFLDNNQGKVLNLMNGVNFDFDLGYENLYSVTIHDTGVDSSQLVLDYRTSEIILPGETLVIDPTFTGTPTSEGSVYGQLSTATTCLAPFNAGSALLYTIRPPSSVNDWCRASYFNFDVSSIPTGVTVSSASIEYDIITSTTPVNCDWKHLDFTGATNAATYNALVDGTGSVTDIIQNSSTCTGGVANNYSESFNTGGYASLIESDIDGDQVVSIGITPTSWTRDGSTRYLQFRTADASLSVTYSTAPAPDSITDLTLDSVNATDAVVSFTAPGLNGESLQTYSFYLETPQTDNVIQFFVNSTDNPITLSGLTWGTPYSLNASAATAGGYNFTDVVILNFTTTSTTYSGVAPTGLTVNDCSHTCSTQLNLEWTATLMDAINGFRIFFETPIGNGFTTLTSNTTTTTTYYNDTGLTPGVFYNYKVAAMNGTGISENSTAFARTPHKLPDSVTDLVITPNALLQFDAAWTAPTLYGTLSGYQINYTTPAGDPVTIYTSTNPGVTATISGLNPTVEYSFRVSANTYHGTNTTLGNIENATASSEIAVGDLTFDAGTNPDTDPIWYENYLVDSTTNDVQVRYDAALTVDCTITERLEGNVYTYTGLSETVSPDGYVYHNFTVTNAGNDILDWDCYSQADALVNGQYALSQSESSSGVGGFGNVPLFQQMGNFTAGLYGTEGNFAGIDLITLFIVIVSMLGFNRQNPALGVGVMAIMLGAAWYFELIPWTSGVLGGIAIVVVLAIGQGTKKD